MAITSFACKILCSYELLYSRLSYICSLHYIVTCLNVFSVLFCPVALFVFCSIVLHRIALRCMILHGVVLYCTKSSLPCLAFYSVGSSHSLESRSTS